MSYRITFLFSSATHKGAETIRAAVAVRALEEAVMLRDATKLDAAQVSKLPSDIRNIVGKGVDSVNKTAVALEVFSAQIGTAMVTLRDTKDEAKMTFTVAQDAPFVVSIFDPVMASVSRVNLREGFARRVFVEDEKSAVAIEDRRILVAGPSESPVASIPALIRA